MGRDFYRESTDYIGFTCSELDMIIASELENLKAGVAGEIESLLEADLDKEDLLESVKEVLERFSGETVRGLHSQIRHKITEPFRFAIDEVMGERDEVIDERDSLQAELEHLKSEIENLSLEVEALKEAGEEAALLAA
jgi:predicted nuclease with TOPRIM domain